MTLIDMAKTRKCRSFNQKGAIYPASFLPTYIKNNLRFSRMKKMSLPVLRLNNPIYSATQSSMKGNCVFLGEFQPIGSKKVKISRPILEQIADADHYVLNLESTLCEKEPCHASFSILPRFAITLAEFKETLRPFNIPFEKLVVNIANNHSFDKGAASIKTTTQLLKSLGCHVIGTKADPYYKIGGVRIVGCTTKLNPLSIPHASDLIQPDDPLFTDPTPTIPYVHWGWEYYEDPDPDTVALSQKWMGDECYKSSIIGIVGHGPHLLQKTTNINGRPCVYSLGDTLVRSKRPVSKGNPRALSSILRVQLAGGTLSNFHMIPVLQEHTKDMISLINPDTDDARARFKALYS